jgi:ribosomal protein L37AE/L43A
MMSTGQMMMDDTAQFVTCIFCSGNIRAGSVFTGLEGGAACRPCLLKASEIIHRINVNHQCNFCGKITRANKLVESMGDLHLCEECIESALSRVQEADGKGIG